MCRHHGLHASWANAAPCAGHNHGGAKGMGADAVLPGGHAHPGRRLYGLSAHPVPALILLSTGSIFVRPTLARPSQPWAVPDRWSRLLRCRRPNPDEAKGLAPHIAPGRGSNVGASRMLSPSSLHGLLSQACRSLLVRPLVGLIAIALVSGVAGSARGAAPEGQLTWAVHVTLAPTWFDPAETSGIITPYMVLYAIHDAMVKPMPGNSLAPSLAETI